MNEKIEKTVRSSEADYSQAKLDLKRAADDLERAARIQATRTVAARLRKIAQDLLAETDGSSS